jgi:hypothetical protein
MEEGTGALQIATQERSVAAWSADQVGEQVRAIQELMSANMRDKEHFGVIPGCGDKPALLKPGAEKLCLMFRLAPKFHIETKDLGNGHREITVTCSLHHINTGAFWGEGVGSCSTMEAKYRYRGNEAISTQVPVPKEYWDLKRAGNFKEAKEKLGGDGYMPKKFDDGWFICEKGQKTENPDIADVYNTVLKMAKKRALVDATLTATAASDIFTQDIEENAPAATPSVVAAPVAQPEPTGETFGKRSPDENLFTSRFVVSPPIPSKNKKGSFYHKATDAEGANYYVHDKKIVDALAASKDQNVTVRLETKDGFTSIIEVLGL